MFAKLLFLVGAKLRNPSLFAKYRDLKRSEFSSAEELRLLQFNKLLHLLKIAKDNSVFYKDKFDNIDIDNFKSVDDLAKLPCVEKFDLIRCNQEIHTNIKGAKVRKAETSGTSGQSLSFYRNEEWDSANRAMQMRCYDWYGVKPWDKNGYFWGFNISSKKSRLIKFLDFLQNRQRLFSYDKKSIEQFSKDMKDAVFLSGYSSMIYQVAKSAKHFDIKFDKLKMVKGTSEMILPAYQKESLEAFGMQIVSEYGAAETGLISFECPEGNNHILEENVIVETDENGEILVTNLESISFPIIRYRLGDVVTIDSELKCKCGRNHAIVKEIKGRKGTNVKGKTSSYPSLSFYYVFKNISQESNVLLNYKVVQSMPGKVDIFIEGNESREVKELVSQQMEKYFKDDLDFVFHFLHEFNVEKKKSQYFVSELKDE